MTRTNVVSGRAFRYIGEREVVNQRLFFSVRHDEDPPNANRHTFLCHTLKTGTQILLPHLKEHDITRGRPPAYINLQDVIRASAFVGCLFAFLTLAFFACDSGNEAPPVGLARGRLPQIADILGLPSEYPETTSPAIRAELPSSDIEASTQAFMMKFMAVKACGKLELAFSGAAQAN